MKKAISIVTVCGLLLLTPVILRAQGKGGSPRDRARTFLVVRIAEALQLSDEEALKVSGMMRAAEDRRKALLGERQEVERQLSTVLDKGERDAPALTKLVDQANGIDDKLALIPEQTMREVQKLLTPEKQARLVLFRPELRSEIQRGVRQRLRMRQGQAGPSEGGDTW
jgi:hypothetical protein